MSEDHTEGDHSGPAADRPALEVVRAADSTPSGPLTDEDRDLLQECEAAIEGDLHDLRHRLRLIRDGRLYRATHLTFEAYCQERWTLSRPRAYALMAWTEVEEILVSRIRDIPPPSNTQQAEALAPLRRDPPALEAVWRQAVSTHGDHPTGAQVKAIADRKRARPASSRRTGTRQIGNGTLDPEPDHESQPHVVPGQAEIMKFFGDLNTPGWPTGPEAAKLVKAEAAEPSSALLYAVDWMRLFVAEFDQESLKGELVSIDKSKPVRSVRRRRS
jgi:hypothetical protein